MPELDEAVSRFERALLALDRLMARHVLIERDGLETPLQRVEKLVVPALERIGQDWEQGTVALSQVYMSGRICEELVDALLLPGSADRKSQPQMAIAALQDYHLLGKRIVYSVLRASGFELLDYGRIEAGDLVHRVMNDHVEIVLISTLMLPSALRVKDVRAMLKASGYDAKIVVGGAPFRFDDYLWQEVGADAVGRNASDAIDIVNQLAGGQR